MWRWRNFEHQELQWNYALMKINRVRHKNSVLVCVWKESLLNRPITEGSEQCSMRNALQTEPNKRENQFQVNKILFIFLYPTEIRSVYVFVGTSFLSPRNGVRKWRLVCDLSLLRLYFWSILEAGNMWLTRKPFRWKRNAENRKRQKPIWRWLFVRLIVEQLFSVWCCVMHEASSTLDRKKRFAKL